MLIKYFLVERDAMMRKGVKFSSVDDKDENSIFEKPVR
jgi:hypothetical protein